MDTTRAAATVIARAHLAKAIADAEQRRKCRYSGWSSASIGPLRRHP